MRTEIFLDLSHHCIETAARRVHRELVDQLVGSSAPAPDLADKLLLLQQFLDATDFPRLRAEQPSLAGGVGARVIVARSDAGDVVWRRAS